MDDLKLIYILKVGQNTKKENIFEFIFSKDETNVDVENWGWLLSPACDNANPPTEDYIDKVSTIKTDEFDLFCLHDATDREYLQGYHTIHALAYEIENDDNFNFQNLYPDEEKETLPLLVFHYGMSIDIVRDLLRTRDIRLD